MIVYTWPALRSRYEQHLTKIKIKKIVLASMMAGRCDVLLNMDIYESNLSIDELEKTLA